MDFRKCMERDNKPAEKPDASLVIMNDETPELGERMPLLATSGNKSGKK